jgi:hypothetical protein
MQRFGLPAGSAAAGRVCLQQPVPVPGAAASVRLLAVRCERWSALLGRVVALLSVCAEPAGSGWSGPAARAFATSAKGRLPVLSAAQFRYAAYAGALSAYAYCVEGSSGRIALLRREIDARVPVGLAAVTLSPVAAWGAGAPAASGAVPPAGDDEVLRGLTWQFKSAWDEWADAVDRCCASLRTADHDDRVARDKHGWSAWASELDHAMRYVAPLQYLLLHPSLHNASECLSILGTELTVLGIGLLFICPPAGAACLAVAAVVSAAQLGVDVIRREQGERVGASTLGWDAIGAVPFGGSEARGLRVGSEAITAVEHLLPNGARDISHLVPGGGLAAHEAAGGHTLDRHVGRDLDYLRNRLATEPDLQAASTFYDRATAERAIAQILRTNEAAVGRWLRSGPPRLTLDGTVSVPVGQVLRRGLGDPVDVSDVRVILSRMRSGPLRFRIHTAMVMP